MDPQESSVHVKQAWLLAAIRFPSQEQSYRSGAQQGSAACQPSDKHRNLFWLEVRAMLIWLWAKTNMAKEL